VRLPRLLTACPLFLSLFLSLFLLAACGGTDQPAPAPMSLAVIGDMPYGTSPTDTAEYDAAPGLIAAINADADVRLVLHAGDIHSGKQYCTEDYDRRIATLFQTFQDPLVYTPGDNEWTDCHKAKEGGGSYNASTGAIDYQRDAAGRPLDYALGDPAANLALLRSVFFATPGQTLGGALAVTSQAASGDASDRAFPENVWVEQQGVLIATINLPGGSNNDTDPWYGAPAMSGAQRQEVAARTAADLHWLDNAFQRATNNGDRAVLLMLQADMWDLDGNAPAHIAEYRQFIDSIAARAKAYGKPVLLINGDSHTYRSDNPLQPGAPCSIETGTGLAATACADDAYASQPHGYDVPNFHRVVVHGSSAPLEWLKLTIDPSTAASSTDSAFGPFRWQRMRAQ
jgi:hypothetical protein